MYTLNHVIQKCLRYEKSCQSQQKTCFKIGLRYVDQVFSNAASFYDSLYYVVQCTLQVVHENMQKEVAQQVQSIVLKTEIGVKIEICVGEGSNPWSFNNLWNAVMQIKRGI